MEMERDRGGLGPKLGNKKPRTIKLWYAAQSSRPWVCASERLKYNIYTQERRCKYDFVKNMVDPRLYIKTDSMYDST